MARTIIAIFDNDGDAQRAAEALRHHEWNHFDVHAGAPSPTIGGTMLAVTSDDGPVDEVMEIVNRHHPTALDQHTQGSFDAGDAAMALHVPTFSMLQKTDEALGREDWATVEGKEIERDDDADDPDRPPSPRRERHKRLSDPHEEST